MNITIYILMAVIIFILSVIFFGNDNLREEILYLFGLPSDEYYLGIVPIIFRSLLCGVFWPIIVYFIIMMVIFKLLYLLFKLVTFLLGIDIGDTLFF